MRRLFSPPKVLKPEGTIDQNYFKPKSFVKWTETDLQSLFAGLEEFGVGNWEQIIAHHLPLRTELDVRIQVCRLFGRQDLSEYTARKFTQQQVQEEFQASQLAFKHLSFWKNGVLLKCQVESPADPPKSPEIIDNEDEQ